MNGRLMLSTVLVAAACAPRLSPLQAVTAAWNVTDQALTEEAKRTPREELEKFEPAAQALEESLAVLKTGTRVCEQLVALEQAASVIGCEACAAARRVAWEACE